MSATVRGLIFIVCALLLVPGLFGKTFGEAERYGYLADIMPGDWAATNVWLDSTDCTLARGTWLALCEDGKLVPISERAQADDPGHALLLNAWSAATGRRATLTDVARLNTILNTLGLLALAGLLVALRTWGAAAALLNGPLSAALAGVSAPDAETRLNLRYAKFRQMGSVGLA